MSEKELLRRLSIQLERIIELLERKENNTSKKMGRTGRPSKEHLVRLYRNRYPNGRKMQCVREMKLSIKTVSKYWHKHEEKEILYLEE